MCKETLPEGHENLMKLLPRVRTSGSTYSEPQQSHRPTSIVESNTVGLLDYAFCRPHMVKIKQALSGPHFDLGFSPLNLSRAPCDLVNTSFKIPQIHLGPF